MKRGAVTPTIEKEEVTLPTKLSLTQQEREKMIQDFLPVIKYMAMRMAMRISSGLKDNLFRQLVCPFLWDFVVKIHPPACSPGR